LQNELTITAKVKNSLEKQLVSLKKTLFNTKNQYRDELTSLTARNQKLELQIQKLDSEVPAFKSENEKLLKQLESLKNQHKSLAN